MSHNQRRPVTNFDRAIDIADYLDEVGESLFELVRQLHTAGLITPDPSEGCATYYDPYEPDDSAPIYRLEPKEGTP
ncbi:hypothetical protein ACN4DJ_05885 [Corynebacterium macclintockiae]|uniref:hypothetical protein n=1 Tax=Corynebacterium macclintockiae TaxID=2913501 RepID=UPI003EBB941B